MLEFGFPLLNVMSLTRIKWFVVGTLGLAPDIFDPGILYSVLDREGGEGETFE